MTLTGLYVALTMTAAPVSLAAAQLNAHQFINERGKSLPLQLVQSSDAHGLQQSAAYYVFNVGQRQGFVIVSGDDRTPTVLGYCDEGAFSEETMPDNMRAWLQNYADELKWMQAHDARPVTAVQSPARNAISPLVATLWNQDDPYNRLCPLFLTNRQSVTGCVATAMAQVLYYHGSTSGRPTGTTQAIPAYTCSTKWNGNTKIEVEEKPVITFQWDKMLTSYENKTGEAYSEQCEAVAQLMAYCGAATEMDYADNANGGSSTSQLKALIALNNYFDMEATLLSRDAYSYTQWTKLIYEELKAGRPVIYDGQSSGGGHAFVIDGYDGGELFHINWGWGGNSNGYFALSACDPDNNSGIGASSSDDGYSYEQNAIVGIQPTTGADELVRLTFERLRVYDNDRIGVIGYNRTSQERTFDIGLGYMSESGHITQVIPLLTEAVLRPNLGRNLTATIDGSSMPAGTYKLAAVSKESSSEQWIAENLSKNYVEAVFNGAGSVELTAHPSSTLPLTASSSRALSSWASSSPSILTSPTWEKSSTTCFTSSPAPTLPAWAK